MLSKILVLALFGCSFVLGSPIPNQKNGNDGDSIDYNMSLQVKFHPSSGLNDLQENVLNNTIANLHKNIDFLHKLLMAKGAKKHVGSKVNQSVVEEVSEENHTEETVDEAEDNAFTSSVGSSQTEEPANDNAESQSKECSAFDLLCKFG